MPLAPKTQVGCHEIRSLLGVGGMGEVYLAQDTSLNRRVALKVLPPEVASNQDRMRRFKQEASAGFMRITRTRGKAPSAYSTAGEASLAAHQAAKP